MPTYLIVANQTLGGAALGATIRDRIERGDARFRVVVPLIEPAEETTAWMAVDPVFGIPAQPPTTASQTEEGRTLSQRRLDRILASVHTAGAVADGRLGPRDPYEAACGELEAGGVDEVIVSTLPSTLSRWLKMDLPSRIARATDVPVTTVEAHGPDDD